MATNSIIPLLVLSISCLCSTRDVYIQPSEGEHCPGTCYNITTLGKMADNFSNSSGLVVHFSEGTHLLDLQELVVFTNLTNAVFEGDEIIEQGFHETVWQSTVVIRCTERSSTGIAFINSSNITFRYITITNCGADMMRLLPVQFKQHSVYFCNPSLGFFSAGDITIDKTSIHNGSGSSLMIAMDGYDLTITNSLFAHNLSNTKCAIANTNNVVVSYADPLNCVPRQHLYNTLIANSIVMLLEDSKAHYYVTAGIFVLVTQSSYMVNLVLDSVVVYGASGSSGFIQSHDNIYILTTVCDVVTYSLTVNNSLSSNTNGFGLSVGDSFFGCIPNFCTIIPSSNLDLVIVIANSSFTYNNGGIYIEFIADYSPRITVYSTVISHNMGPNGISFVSYAYQSQFHVTLQNVIVNNNTYIFPYSNINSRQYSYSDTSNGIDLSAVHAEFVTTLVLNNVSITNNTMTGLTVYNSAVIVNGNSTSVFHNNTGIDGGGLAMYGNSYLVFQEYSLLNFTNNKAKHRGGAIFVDSSTKYVKFACFFQYSSHITKLQSAKAFLSGNKADIAGSVLFGGEIDSCSLYFTKLNLIFGSKYFHKIFHYSAQTGASVISSEPTDVCFCDGNNTINCSQKQLTMTAYPGEEINFFVATVGQENGVAPGIVEMKPLGDGLILESTRLYNTSAMNCTVIQFTPIDVNYTLSVFNQNVSPRMLIIAKYDCPLGFQISNQTKSCDCNDQLKAESVKCNAATKTITRQGNIWVGNISDCVVIHSPCPLDYCKLTNAIFSLTDPDPQCALTRTGILCGGCKQNFSLALGSNNCIQCPQFSYLALIIPFAAAGFGLVAFLMVLNLTVSIGTINGLIFYASIVKISESTGIFFPNGPIPVLSLLIAWLNLDLGIETCFYPGMTAYAKVWLQFVFPLYIWFIIATIIVLCRYSTWLSNKIGGNVVQVLATLILLSFTKIFRTFAPALTWIKLSCESNSTTVWYVDGNVSYFSLKHYILIAAAVLFLLLAVPYTLALLFDAVIEKYLTKISFFRRQWIKFKPFVDAYHGPYKDNCRFWTGLSSV